MSVIRRILLKRRCFDLKSFCVARNLSSSNPNGNILTCDVDDVDELPNTTIHEFIYSKIENFSKYTATESAETGKSYTYEELRVKSRNLSKALRKILKLEKNDTIAFFLPNVPEFPICILGALEAGLVITTLNPLYTPEEISRQLLDSSTKAIITLVGLHGTVKAAVLLTKQTLPIVTIKIKDESIPEGAINFTELANAKLDIPDFEPGNPSDVALLPYSSGTTGLPKGVELTHHNIVSNISQMIKTDPDYCITTTDTFQERIPAVLPMFHIYGFTTVTLLPLSLGNKLITLPKFTPDLFISVLKNHTITKIFAAPPLILFLAAHPEVKVEYLKSLRNATSGAAPLGSLDEERFLQKVGTHAQILQGYGLTETSPVVTMATPKLSKKFNCSGSVGKVIVNTRAKIVALDDPTGTPLGPNQSGELLVKGPQVMKGYHNRPQETKDAFLDGWFRTGDMMHYNKDGLLYVTDRVKELIKVKGFQVAPAELEEVIRDFPSVADAAVIGIPHPIDGEVPKAFVVSKRDKPLKTEELQEFVAKKVARYKQLKGGVQVVDTIPKNSAGKILRRELKLKYEANK